MHPPTLDSQSHLQLTLCELLVTALTPVATADTVYISLSGKMNVHFIICYRQTTCEMNINNKDMEKNIKILY